MGECYICTLETDNLSNCKCTNMVLHEECQLRIIRANNNCLKCKVCDTEYINVELKTITTKKLNYKFFKRNGIPINILQVLIVGVPGVSGFCYSYGAFNNNAFVKGFVMGVAAIYIMTSTCFIGLLCLRIYRELKKGLYIIETFEVLKIKSKEDIKIITDIV